MGDCVVRPGPAPDVAGVVESGVRSVGSVLSGRAGAGRSQRGLKERKALRAVWITSSFADRGVLQDDRRAQVNRARWSNIRNAVSSKRSRSVFAWTRR